MSNWALGVRAFVHFFLKTVYFCNWNGGINVFIHRNNNCRKCNRTFFFGGTNWNRKTMYAGYLIVFIFWLLHCITLFFHEHCIFKTACLVVEKLLLRRMYTVALFWMQEWPLTVCACLGWTLMALASSHPYCWALYVWSVFHVLDQIQFCISVCQFVLL